MSIGEVIGSVGKILGITAASGVAGLGFAAASGSVLPGVAFGGGVAALTGGAVYTLGQIEQDATSIALQKYKTQNNDIQRGLD